MTSPVHSFQGRALQRADVRFGSFREILDSRLGDSRAFLTFYSHGKKSFECTFDSFVKTVFGWSDRLARSGLVVRGRPVVVLLGNSCESFVVYSALLDLGAIVMPVDPNESKEYVTRVAKFADATGAIAFGEWKTKLADSALRCLEIDSITGLPSGVGSSTRELLDAPASVFFTSGTTGDAKGVLQTIGSTFANAEGTLKVGRIDSNDVLGSSLPLYHVNAFNFSFLLPLYAGCRIVYMDGYTPSFWRILGDEKVSVVSASPPLMRLLLKDVRTVETPKSLRYFISASSALHRPDLDGMRDRFGVRICQAYGLSETINFTLFTPPDLTDEDYDVVVSSGEVPPAGCRVWGQDVALMNEACELVADENLPGEVVVRGWNVLREYLNNPIATRNAFSGDWFHTGDVAYAKTVQGKKFFFLCGRLKETVKRQGIQIYLSEIDQVARELGLESACAVGFANVHTDEEIGLFLVRGQNETRENDSILKEFAARLPFAKRPKVIVEGSEIPKTSVGKIRRNELKKAFAAHAETRFHQVKEPK